MAIEIDKLFNWYEVHKRQLPWRETQNPYKIWASEIILQQTRVNQGLDYYVRFIERFPDVKVLAKADEQEVLKIWQGLGYYSRARNMHKAAKLVVSEYGGHFPNNAAELQRLPGIGAYTAAAIASMAFDEQIPAIDGNVMRVVARWNALEMPVNEPPGKKAVEAFVRDLIPKTFPGIFNQAMMEFGALHCTPQNPDCSTCVFNNSCEAFLKNQTHSLPVRNKKKKPRNRFFNYLVVFDENQCLFLKKRTAANDIWHNLYDFPLIETIQPVDFEGLMNQKEIQRMLAASKQQDVGLVSKTTTIHKLTHQTLTVTFWQLNAVSFCDAFFSHNAVKAVEKSAISLYPFPRVVDWFVNEHLFFKKNT